MKFSDEDWEAFLYAGITRLRESSPRLGRYTLIEKHIVAEIANLYIKHRNRAAELRRLVP